MKKLLFATFSCGLVLSSFAASSERVEKNVTRKQLSDEVLSYSIPKADEDNKQFWGRKYLNNQYQTWNCHDPKLFQDPDSHKYYVYSTGWADGVQVRSSDDLIHWARHKESAFWDVKDVSRRYNHMHWDDDFLSWVGYITNEGLGYRTSNYIPLDKPNSWAPTVVKQDGRYYMFHGIITDSLTYQSSLHPAACITLAISDKAEGPFIPAKEYNPDLYKQSTLVRYVWSNKGAQNSKIGYDSSFNTANENWENGFGCIDPEFVMDVATGQLMKYDIGGNECYALTYGSWKGGIALVYVDAKTFKPVNDKTGEELDAPLDSIEGNCGTLIAGGFGAAYEGAQLIYNSETGYYYIFVSMGDLNIEYRVGVGRSKELTGPYKDPKGTAMKFNNAGIAQSYHAIGGKIIGAYQFSSGFGFTSPGGQSILRDDKGRILFACHSRTNFMTLDNFTLQVRTMHFTEDGWPVLNMNEYTEVDDDDTSITMADLVGDWEVIVTERSENTSVDGTATGSKNISIAADGSVSGKYKGSVSIAEDGHTITFDLKKIGVCKGWCGFALDTGRRSGNNEQRRTVTFSTLNTGKSGKKGEYFFGNKKASK